MLKYRWRNELCHITDCATEDPPYAGTTGYGDAFDVVAYASQRNCWVSEAKPLSPEAMLLADSKSRTRGGISGNRSSANEEWLSHFALGA